MPSRVLLIGWDGADWRILDPLLERGVLPNLAALIDRGGRAVLTSTIPTHSWAAWPSFLTGVDPDGHGVYDILEGRGGAREVPGAYPSVKERTFPHDLGDGGAESLPLNVPPPFAPPPIKGETGGRTGSRRVPDARRRSGETAVANGAQRPGHLHERPRVPVGHPSAAHGPAVGAPRLPRVLRLQQGVRSHAVGASPNRGTQGLRPPLPPRTCGPSPARRLGEHP